MVKKLLVAFLATGLAFAVTPVVAGNAVTTASVSAVAPTAVKDYSTKSKNKYWTAMKRLSSDSRILGKKSTIETGTLVCDLLRAGGDLSDLADIAYEADSSIQGFIIAAMGAAPVYLCRDQQYKFD